MWHHKQKYNINQQGVYSIHYVIVTECDNYYSTEILKYATILAEVISSHDLHFLRMIPIKNNPVLNVYTHNVHVIN